MIRKLNAIAAALLESPLAIILLWLLLILVTATACSAAPPMPSRALQSPRAASVPKVKAMTLPYTPGPMSIIFTKDINILFCDPADPGCVLYDKTDVETIQRAGFELSIYLRDGVADEGALVFTSGAAPFDRVSGFSLLQPVSQRPVMRFFSERQTIAPTGGFTTAAVGIKVAPKFSKQVTPWTRKR